MVVGAPRMSESALCATGVVQNFAAECPDQVDNGMPNIGFPVPLVGQFCRETGFKPFGCVAKLLGIEHAKRLYIRPARARPVELLPLPEVGAVNVEMVEGALGAQQASQRPFVIAQCSS